MKRILSLLFIAGILVGMTSCSQDAKKQYPDVSAPFAASNPYLECKNENYIPCGQSVDLALSFQPNTTHFKVENLKDRSVWCSNPENAKEDEIANKRTRLRMMSTLEIEYVNLQTKKHNTINNYTSNILSGKYEIFTGENGVTFKYPIKEIGKNIFLSVYLEQNSLMTECWYENSDTKIKNIEIYMITVLPYFIHGSSEDRGYLFIPDGSGALIDFSKKVTTGGGYCRPIYGFEATDITSDYYLDVENTGISLPVYGAKVNQGAIMAICEEGAAEGQIYAEAVGQGSSYASACTKYKLLNSVEYQIGNTTTELFDKVGNTLDAFTTRYYFLDGKDADYSGMARKYRDYLFPNNDGENVAGNNGFYADVIAATRKKTSTLGVPHEVTVPLTDPEQLNRIITELKKQNIDDIALRYRFWNQDEITGNRVESGRAAKGFSVKKLKKIQDARLYPSILNLFTYSKGSYFDRLIYGAKSVTQLPFSWHSFSLSNLNKLSDMQFKTAVGHFDKINGKILNGLSEEGFKNAAFGDVANTLYCDFSKQGYKRSDTMRTAISFLKEAKTRFSSVCLDRANAYALPYADTVYCAPIDNSNQDILDHSVPFYTMVLSGAVECVASPYNGMADDDTKLRTVAAGAGICVTWIYEDTDALRNTEIQGIGNVNFEKTFQEALSEYQSIREIYQKTEKSRINSHRYITDNVSVTEYENGVSVYVNFGDQAYSLPDKTVVPPKSYIAKEENG